MLLEDGTQNIKGKPDELVRVLAGTAAVSASLGSFLDQVPSDLGIEFGFGLRLLAFVYA